MSAVAERTLWICSRVPQTLPCSKCGHTATFLELLEPDRYQYGCSACLATSTFTLQQINALEASRFRKLPSPSAAISAELLRPLRTSAKR